MVFSNNLLLGAGGQGTGPSPFDTTLIGNSVWLDGSADFLKRDNFALSADGRKEFIFSMWIQRNEFERTQTHFDLLPTGHTSYNDGSHFLFQADDQLEFSVANSGSGAGQKVSSAMYRDIGWYHVLISYNTNAAIAAASRHRLFVNGLEITDTSVYTAPPDNESCIGSGTGNADLRIGRTDHSGIPYPPNAYFAQACYLEGKSFQAGDYAITDFLDTFTFGTNGSQFVPKADAEIAALATAAGGNSFCLDFADSSNLGNDISANNNDFTTNSMSSANQSSSTPSLVYPTLNTLDKNSAATLSSGNLRYSSSSSVYHGVRSTFWIDDTTPKIYWEATYVSGGGSSTDPIGLADYEYLLGQLPVVNGTAVFYTNTKGSTASFSNETVQTYNTASYDADTGDVLRFAYDPATKKLWVGNATNGTYLGGGDPATDSTPTATLTIKHPCSPAVGRFGTLGTTTYDFNFGQTAFTGTVPTGFVSLNSANLTAPDYQGIDYFDATLYEGNGTGQRVGDFVPFTDVGTISQSVAFNAADEDELRIASSVSTSPTNVQKKTVSCWLKPLEARENWIIVGNGGSDNSERIYSDSTGRIQYLTRDGANSNAHVQTAGTFLNDPSQWVHVVVALDYTDGSTEADRVKIYVNGVRQTSLSATTYPANNMTAQAYINKASTEQIIGCHPDFHAANDHSNMYYAEYFMVDGHQLDASVFGQLDTSTNRWVAKASSTVTTAIGALSGGFGNCGFYLDFSNTSDYGEDDSGNNRDFTEGGVLDATNQFIDAPSLNFATIDPIISNGATPVTLSKGNLTGVRSSSGFQQAYSSFSGFRLQENTGIYFAEVLVGSDTSSFHVGVLSGDPPSSTNRYLGQDSNTYGYDLDGRKVNNGTYTSYGASYTAGDVIGIEIDTGTGSINFHKNGSDQGQAFTAVAGPYNFAFASESGGGPGTFNFGQQMELGGASTTLNAAAGGRFKHTPPTDAKALNQDNLDDTASKLTALAWIKNRDAADDNIWMDRVIGTGGYLSTTQNDSGTAATAYGDGGTDVLTTNANAVQRFLQRGVQVGSDENVNTANESYVLWQWLLGDSATTGSSITTGSPSLATTGVVSDANHFSIVQYTGNGTDNATFAHGLGSTPNFVMIKRISGSATNSDWVIHVPGLGTENYIYPHYRIALATGAGANGMVPDANLVEISTGVATNTSGATHMAYSFKNTPGLCKIGTYVGNSSTNGSYVSTGFRPSWLWIFNTTLTSADAERPIFDTARYKFNGTTTAGGSNGGVNFSDQRAAEEAQNTSLGANPAIDILSDGFKLRANDSTINTGTTYMYICMADIAGNGTLPPVYGR